MDYKLLVTVIEDDDIDRLKKELLTLPLNELTQFTLDKLLSKLINATTTFGNQKAIQTIFEVWYDQLNIENGQLDHLTRLFCDVTVTFEALRLASLTFIEQYSIEYYIEKLIDYDSNPFTSIALKNLERLFVVKNDVWQYLFAKSVDNELIKGYTNRIVKAFLEEKIRETNTALTKPSYIIGDNKLSHTDLINSITIFKSFNLEVLARKRLEMNFDENLFRILGPANTSLTEDLLTDDICHIYGGCRMLTCIEYETQRVDDESVDEEDPRFYLRTDWFTGSCDYCFNKIKYLHYAVRKPIHNGGWIGCYCTFKCVRDSLANEIIVKRLVDIFEQQLNQIGIQDRTY